MDSLSATLKFIFWQINSQSSAQAPKGLRKRPVFKIPTGPVMKKKSSKVNPSSGRSETQASSAPATAGSGFSGFSGGDVITATRRVRDGEDSDEEWDDFGEDELKNDPSWSPAGRSSSPGGRGGS